MRDGLGSRCSCSRSPPRAASRAIGGEHEDVAARERGVAVDLARVLRRGESPSFGRRERPLDPATVERLRGLGYTAPE